MAKKYLPTVMNTSFYCYLCSTLDSTGNDQYNSTLQHAPHRHFFRFATRFTINTSKRTVNFFPSTLVLISSQSKNDTRGFYLGEYVMRIQSTKTCWVLEPLWYGKYTRPYFFLPPHKKKNSSLATSDYA